MGRPIFTANPTWEPGDKLNAFNKELGRMVILSRPTVYDKLIEVSS